MSGAGRAQSAYLRILARSVERAMPRRSAAWRLLPSVKRSAAAMWRASAASSVSGAGSAAPSVTTKSGPGATGGGTTVASS